MTKYLRVKETYCGCVPVQYFAIISSCITLALQLTFSIFFLIYGSLWGLMAMACTILSHIFFMIIILKFDSPVLMTVYIGCEIAYTFTILGFAIWILSWIIDPRVSFLYSYCTDVLQYTHCFQKTQIVSLIWGCVFVIFFFVCVLILPVYKNTWRNIKTTRRTSSLYIDGENAQCAPAVQPIFNINSAPAAPPAPTVAPAPQQMVYPQIMPAPAQNVLQMPVQSSNIMTPTGGTIQLNLYTIQLPTGTTLFSTSNALNIEQLSSNFSDTVSATEVVDERL